MKVTGNVPTNSQVMALFIKSFNYNYMWVVYNYKTREIHFEGTPKECIEYIDNIPGSWNNPVDMIPKKYYNECALPATGTN